MNFFFRNLEGAAGYVGDMVRFSRNDCRLTTIITPVKSGGFCVQIAIDTSWDDTDYQTALASLKAPLPIYEAPIPGG